MNALHKSIATFLILTLNCLIAIGQEEFDLPEQDAVWVNAYYLTNDEDPYFPFCELIQNLNFCVQSGDTTINDEVYTPLYQCDADGTSEYFGAFRNFDHKVFLIPSGDENELLVYDFEPEEGEEVTIYTYPEPELWYPQTYIASNIVTETINGVERVTHQAIDSQIISGLGNASGLFSFLDAILNGCNELDCVSQGEDVLWGDSEGSCALDISVAEWENEDIAIWPNPTFDEWNLTIPRALNGASVRLISSHGELINVFEDAEGIIKIEGDGLMPGIYFIEIYSSEQRFTKKIIKN